MFLLKKISYLEYLFRKPCFSSQGTMMYAVKCELLCFPFPFATQQESKVCFFYREQTSIFLTKDNRWAEAQVRICTYLLIF